MMTYSIWGDKYCICDFKVNFANHHITFLQSHVVVAMDEFGRLQRRIGSETITPFPNEIDISDADVLIGDSHGNQFHVVVFSNNDKIQLASLV